jgi:hypothetical protein
MVRSAGKPTPHDAFRTGLLAFEPVENTPGLFLTLASRPATFPYARLLALAHTLPALCNDPVSNRRNRHSITLKAQFCKQFIAVLYQGAEMLTHHALKMLSRRTGLTKTR